MTPAELEKIVFSTTGQEQLISPIEDRKYSLLYIGVSGSNIARFEANPGSELIIRVCKDVSEYPDWSEYRETTSLKSFFKHYPKFFVEFKGDFLDQSTLIPKVSKDAVSYFVIHRYV